ncbi:MAG: DUF1273 family protein [Ruminococcus sp.]|nr:DUF1273 family protein [Ruminococcus sp.]
MSDIFPTLALTGLELEKTCCFTGHRSAKLPGEGNRKNPGMKRLESTLELAIYDLVNNSGVKYFVSGMANGIDIICAEAVVRLKSSSLPDIELVCAIPYLGQIDEMKTPQEKYLYSLLESSSFISVVLADNYYKDCYKERNKFMVDNSAHLLAVYKPSVKGSGTLQTINYATACGLDIKIIDLDKSPQFYSDQ